MPVTKNERLRKVATQLGDEYDEYLIIARPIGDDNKLHIYSNSPDEVDALALLAAGDVVLSQSLHQSMADEDERNEPATGE